MARKVVPQKTLVTCDRCGDGAGEYGMWLKGDEKYPTWDGAWGGNVSFDFCKDCTKEFREFVKGMASRAKEGKE